MVTRFAVYSGSRWSYLTKGLVFYVDWKSLRCIYFMKNTYIQVYVWCHKYIKKNTVKDAPVNNYEFLNLQASSFRVWVHPPLLPNSSGKLLVLNSSPNIHQSSEHCQVILLDPLWTRFSKIWNTTIFIEEITLKIASVKIVAILSLPLVWGTTKQSETCGIYHNWASYWLLVNNAFGGWFYSSDKCDRMVLVKFVSLSFQTGPDSNEYVLGWF